MSVPANRPFPIYIYQDSTHWYYKILHNGCFFVFYCVCIWGDAEVKRIKLLLAYIQDSHHHHNHDVSSHEQHPDTWLFLLLKYRTRTFLFFATLLSRLLSNLTQPILVSILLTYCPRQLPTSPVILSPNAPLSGPRFHCTCISFCPVRPTATTAPGGAAQRMRGCRTVCQG